MTWRSLLFVPAHDAVRRAKAAQAGADAVILDLEDGVAAADKPAARAGCAAAAAALAAAGVEVVVRINGGWRAALADLEAALCPAVHGVMVPKAEEAGRLAALAGMMAEIEAERGLEAARLLALVETPAGLGSLAAIAAAPRVAGIALGSEDFSLALGVEPSPAVLDLPSRQIALAAAAHGLQSWAVPISIAVFRDTDAYGEAAARAAAYGVTGALCIHPNQVAVANRAFRPSPAALAEAARIVAAWDAAQRDGRAVTSLEGRMIDLPVAVRARRLLGVG